VLVQFCMAHLIRDVKFLLTLPGREDQAYGRRLREALRELFAVIHRRETMTAVDFQKALEAARQQVVLAGTTCVPDTNTPGTWPNASISMERRTSASSPRRASSPPITWPSRRFALWSSTDGLPRERGVRKAAGGANVFGR